MGKLSFSVINEAGIAEIRSRLKEHMRIRFPNYNPCPALDELHGFLVVHDADIVGNIQTLLSGEENIDIQVSPSLYKLLDVAKNECGGEIQLDQFDTYITALQNLVDEVHRIVDSVER